MSQATQREGATRSEGGTTRAPVSVLVPSFNNEAYIEDCLRSVAWADEIVVCDSFSTDSTAEIARRYAHRVLEHEYVDSASQKNWAIPQLSNEWVLIVDTDEQVQPDLRREIEYALAHPGGFTGFRLPRANVVFGRPLQHGGDWPDYQIRLFRKESGHYENRRVHAHVILHGPMGTLTSPLMHYPHSSLRAIRKTLLSRYTTWEAEQKHRDGVRFHWHQLIVRPLGAFVTRYLLRAGYRDGWQGLLMACVWAMYVFITYWKLGRLR